MRKILLKANELITKIQKASNPSGNLRGYCTELQSLIDQIQTESKYHYLLFIAEVYSTRLREYLLAETIIKQVIKDIRPKVSLEGTLRLGLINALQHRYTYALKIIEDADHLSEENEQLENVFVDFCRRLLVSSQQSNILNGLKCQYEQKYDEALNFYRNEYQSMKHITSENQYFAAKAIIQLTSIFPNRNFNGIDPQKCKNSLRELYQERGEHDYLAFIQQLQQNYLTQKSYLIKIIQAMQKKQHGMKTHRRVNNSSNIFQADFQTNKLLGILKLQKILKIEKELHPNLKYQFEKCLEEIVKNREVNYSLLSQFIKAEVKIINRVNEMIKRKEKQNRRYFFQIFIKRNKAKDKIEDKTKFPSSNNISMLIPKQKALKTQPNRQELTSLSKDKSTVKSKSTLKQDNIKILDGSYMIKINQTSVGYEKRYFYYVTNEIEKGVLKIYYVKIKENVGGHDQYYEFKRCIKLKEGKKTKALQREECEKFEENLCFSISYDNNRNKNFYVPSERDYRKWITALKKFEFFRQSKSNDKVCYSNASYKLNQTTVGE